MEVVLNMNKESDPGNIPENTPKDAQETDQGQAIIDVEGKILQRAKVKALREVNKNPTAENLRNYRAAEQNLAEYERRRQAVENPDRAEFATVIAAYRYALTQGYSRTRQTMDNHIKSGRLRASRDGKILQVDLERYLDQELGAMDEAGDDNLSAKKQEAEVRKLTAQADHWTTRTRRERGELIEVAAVEQELARRAAFLRADLENFFRVKGEEIIDRVQGDVELTAELIDWGLELVEAWLDRYSRPMEMTGTGREGE